MIRSMNEGVHDAAKAQYADWKAKYEEARKGLKENEPTPDGLDFCSQVKLICDCCLKVVDYYRADDFKLRGEIAWDGSPAKQTTPPPWVEVGGARYWACKEECARILFLVHHQYAMNGAGEGTRFIKNDGRIVDLDRVLLVTVRHYVDQFQLVRFVLSETVSVDIIADDVQTEAYLKAWKERPAQRRS